MRYLQVPPGYRSSAISYVLSPNASTPTILMQETFSDYQQSIRIDNLSNVWLYVEPLQRFVPPLRIGWRDKIIPATRNITITQVQSPTGQNPVSVGNEQTITVRVSTDLGDESEGTDTTYLSTGVAVITNDLEVNNQEFTSDATPDTTATEDASFSVGTNVGIRLRILQLKYISLGATKPTMWVEVHKDQGGGDPFAYLSCSPAMPTDWIILPDNGIFLPYDASIPGVSIFLKQRSDIGSRNYRMLFGYHRVTSA